MEVKLQNSKLIFLSLIIFCGLFSIGAKASAATYYVKNGGNDSLSGLDDANAWETIAKVQSTVASGDIVYFRSQDTWTVTTHNATLVSLTAGVTYDGATYGSGTRATLTSNNTEGNYYTYHSVVDLSASNVIFRGFEVDANQQPSLTGIYVGFISTGDITNITIDNCEVHNTGGIAGVDWDYGINVTGNNPYVTRNVVIQNTTVHDTFHEGIAVYQRWTTDNNQTDGVLIRNCTVYNAGINSSAGSGGMGILLANDAKNVTVEFCHIHNNDLGIWVRTSPDDPSHVHQSPRDWVFRHNIFYGNRTGGISISPAYNYITNGAIYGNILYNNWETDSTDYSFEISLGGDSGYGDGVINVYNNSIYSITNPYPFAYVVAIGPFTNPITNLSVIFKNNVIVSDTLIPLFDRFGMITDHSNNLLYRTSGASDTHVGIMSTNYNRSGVLTWEPTAQNTNPNFTGGTLPTGFTGTYGSNMLPNTNYFATTTGPTINTGATLGSPFNSSINSAGLASPFLRPQGGAYDIGAYELQGADTTPPSVPGGLTVN